MAGILSTGGEEEDRVFVRLEVLERLTGRAGQVDAIEVGALTKPEDAFARKDPSKMKPDGIRPLELHAVHHLHRPSDREVLPMAVARPIRRVADNEGQVLRRSARPDAADRARGACHRCAHRVERDGHHGARAALRDRHHAGDRRGQRTDRDSVGRGGRHRRERWAD